MALACQDLGRNWARHRSTAAEIPPKFRNSTKVSNCVAESAPSLGIEWFRPDFGQIQESRKAAQFCPMSTKISPISARPISAKFGTMTTIICRRFGRSQLSLARIRPISATFGPEPTNFDRTWPPVLAKVCQCWSRFGQVSANFGRCRSNLVAPTKVGPNSANFRQLRPEPTHLGQMWSELDPTSAKLGLRSANQGLTSAKTSTKFLPPRVAEQS